MFALVKLFSGFRMFAALFGFSDVDISFVRPGKAGFRMFASPFRFSDVRHI